VRGKEEGAHLFLQEIITLKQSDGKKLVDLGTYINSREGTKISYDKEESDIDLINDLPSRGERKI